MLGIKSLRQNFKRFLRIWGIISGTMCKATDLLVIGLSWLLEFSCLSPNATHPQALARSLPPMGSFHLHWVLFTGPLLRRSCVFSSLQKVSHKNHYAPLAGVLSLKAKGTNMSLFLLPQSWLQSYSQKLQRVNPPLLPPTAEFSRRTSLAFSGCAEKYHSPVSQRSSQ